MLRGITDPAGREVLPFEKADTLLFMAQKSPKVGFTAERSLASSRGAADDEEEDDADSPGSMVRWSDGSKGSPSPFSLAFTACV